MHFAWIISYYRTSSSITWAQHLHFSQLPNLWFKDIESHAQESQVHAWTSLYRSPPAPALSDASFPANQRDVHAELEEPGFCQGTYQGKISYGYQYISKQFTLPVLKENTYLLTFETKQPRINNTYNLDFYDNLYKKMTVGRWNKSGKGGEIEGRRGRLKLEQRKEV